MIKRFLLEQRGQDIHAQERLSLTSEPSAAASVSSPKREKTVEEKKAKEERKEKEKEKIGREKSSSSPENLRTPYLSSHPRPRFTESLSRIVL